MSDEDLARLLATVETNPPATEAAVSAAEADLGRNLPLHYRLFLSEADGCEGGLGEGYVALWSVTDLAELNAAYGVDEFVPELLLVGSDGGDTAYALDLRRGDAPLVALPFIPMDYEHIEHVGDTVADLLRAVEAG